MSKGSGLRFVVEEGEEKLEVSFNKKEGKFTFNCSSEADQIGTDFTIGLEDARTLLAFMGSRAVPPQEDLE